MEEQPQADYECKVVLVGDSRVGKTSLIQRFVSDTFNEEYSPTSFQKYSTTYTVGDLSMHFSIWDTSGAGAYDTVRPLAYQDAQVFLLCFSVVDPNSLESALNKWHNEVRHHAANTSVILCGCQSDLRNDKQTLALLEDKFNTPITAEQGVSVGRQIGATTYVETSSKTSAKVVRDAFEVAALAALGKLNKNKPFCPGGGATRSKSKVDLKSELKDRAKSCSLM